jgi:hypothetical protein
MVVTASAILVAIFLILGIAVIVRFAVLTVYIIIAIPDIVVFADRSVPTLFIKVVILMAFALIVVMHVSIVQSLLLALMNI